MKSSKGALGACAFRLGCHFRTLGIAVALTFIASACSADQHFTEASLAPKIESSKIYADDGSTLAVLQQEENREVIPITQIPKHVRDAVVAIEDSRFYSHRGIDLKAIIRALYTNASSGRVREGGSTITQQLVRNALTDVGKEKTLQRKIKEASYAYQVDRAFSKPKILELYLNTVYFGEGAYGIQTAAQTYFGKDVDNVDLAEGALLAALIRSPVNYDPRVNPDAARRRRDLVIDRMVFNKLIPPEVGEAAKVKDVALHAKVDFNHYPAPYFIDYITREIQRSGEFKPLGETEAERSNRLFRGGLRIYTTLNRKAQNDAEEAIAKVLDHPDQDPTASLVSIDPKDGAIKALVGGRDYFADQEHDPCARVGAITAERTPKTCAKVNLALGQAGGGAGRQSGSAFKPFVLATAIGKGKRLTDVYPASACIDIPHADAGGTKPWHVCNYEDQALGNISIAEATYKSVNTVYAQLIMDIGPKDVVDTAEKMGLCETTRPLLPEGKTCVLQAVPAAALGANVVSPLDMASAFTAFPNLGVHPKARSITKITDARGTVLWKPVESKEQVLNPGVAFVTLGALQDVIAKGTASRAGKIGRPAFGKTGTAQEWRDAWFVGGAGTDLVTAVSVNWPDGEIEMKPSCEGRRTTYKIVKDSKGAPLAVPPECRQTRIRVSGGTWPTQIWQLYMLSALEGVPASTFPVPQVEVISVDIDVSQGCLPNPYTPKDLIQKQSFIKGTEPTEICKEPTGPVGATVPSVIGYPEDDARRLLEQAGLVVIRQEEPSRLYPPGRVTRQDPSPGSGVSAGSSVTIWISTTAQVLRKVPDVINMSEDAAKKALTDAGFKVAINRAAGCGGKHAADCIVRDQTPDGGTSAPVGSTVTIFMGPKP